MQGMFCSHDGLCGFQLNSSPSGAITYTTITHTINLKTLECCAQRGLCRVSKPFICYSESETPRILLLRWCLHLPTTIPTAPAHSSNKSFREHRACSLHAITAEQGPCRHPKKKLSQNCHAIPAFSQFTVQEVEALKK